MSQGWRYGSRSSDGRHRTSDMPPWGGAGFMSRIRLNGVGAKDSDGMAEIGAVGCDRMIASVT